MHLQNSFDKISNFTTKTFTEHYIKLTVFQVLDSIGTIPLNFTIFSSEFF